MNQELMIEHKTIFTLNRINKIFGLTSKYANMLQKTSERKTSDISELKQYLDQGYTVHFSDLPKLGVNPKTEFPTPVAICGYPLTTEIYNKIINNGIPYAQDKKYMHLYKVNDALNVDDYNEEDFKQDLKIIFQLIKENKEWQKKINYNESDSDESNFIKLLQFSTSLKSYKTPKTFAAMWVLTENLSNNVSKWNALLRYLGYKAIVDNNHGVLWGGNLNGPGAQVQVYDKSAIDYIKYFTPPAKYKEKKKFIQKKLEENLTKKLKSDKDFKEIELLKKFLLHEDENLRYAAEKAAVNQVSDQEILSLVAVRNKDPEIRRAAVKKITDQQKLKEIAFNEKEYYILNDIFKKITNQDILQELFESSNDLLRSRAV